MIAADAKAISPVKSNAFVLGLLILAALWLVVRPLAGQFNAYSPENGFANAIAALFGLSAGLAALQARPRIHWPERLTLALLLYFGVLSWGLIRSPNLGQGVAQYGEALSYGILLAGGFVLTRLAPGTGRLIARATLAVVATQALAAAWQHFVDLPRLWESVRGGQLAVPEDLASTAGQYRLFGSDVFGSFGNPNSLAAYLLVGLGLLAGFFMQRETASSLQKKDAQHEHAMVVVFAILMGAALFWTHSKGAWVACGALVWFGVMHATIQRKPERRKLLVAATLVGVLAMTLVLALGYFDVLPMPDSLRVRFDYWRATVAMIAAHPLDGVGLGGFFEHYPYYKVPLGTETRDAHNDYLHFLAELGVLGPLMYVALWSVMLRGVAPKDGEETTRLYEPVVLLVGVVGYLMMFFGFQSLNSADLPALFAGEGGTQGVKSLLSTLLLPVLFAVGFRFTRGLTLTQTWRGFGCAAGAILIHQMVDFDFKAPAVTGSLFLLGGALLGEREAEDVETGDVPPLKKASLAMLPMFAMILMLLGVWYPFMSGLARKNATVLEEWMREPVEKRDASRAVEVRELINLRESAAKAAPFDAQAWLDLADALRISYREKRDAAVRTRILEAYSRAENLRPFAAAPNIQYANFQMDSMERGSALEFGQAKFAMAARAYATAAERYPLHPGMRIWEGDARLMSGDIEGGAAAYLKAFAVDKQVLDANVRLTACFTDPRAGAFPRHGMDTEVLMSVIHLIQKDEYSPIARRGLELRRVLALSGAIRSLERSRLGHEKAATEKLRAELGRQATTLPDYFVESGDRAHAALLSAMSWELAGLSETSHAAAWKRARELRSKALSEKALTTPERLFTVLETYFGRGIGRN